MVTITRRLEFDAAHRITKHESKCAHLHGHRYRVDVTCQSIAKNERGAIEELDECGRVIDFSLVKDLCGGFIDEYLDHGCILNSDDAALIEFCDERMWPVYTLEKEEPTAEIIAFELNVEFSKLLLPHRIAITNVRVWETPNCWADWPTT